MFPIRDSTKSLSTPHVNRILILVNVTVFLVTFASHLGFTLGVTSLDFSSELVSRFALQPYYVVQGERLYTLFTSMFLHANFLHIFGNMIYLWVFGDNIEDVFGHAGYFFFYSLCGIVAGLTQILSMTSFSPDDYVLGASGAISGVLGAYIVLFPTSRIQTLILAGFPVIVPLPAILFLGIWFVLQWVSSFYDLSGGVAYWAHIGGFILGMVLAAAFGLRRKKARELRYRPHGFV